MKRCQHCEAKVEYLSTVSDRYGIPYKMVCRDCIEEVEAEIKEYQFDPLDAGENLYPEDY